MGEGIANEILGSEGGNSDVINYPSGYGGDIFNGGGNGGGMSEAEEIEAAIQASLQQMSIAGPEEKKSE